MNELIQKLSHACQSSGLREKKVFHAALYDTLFNKIYLISYRYNAKEADDLTSEIFLKFFELDLKLLAKHSDYLEKYLLRSAINYCINKLKQEAKHYCFSINENIEYIEKEKFSSPKRIDFNLDFHLALKELNKKEYEVFELLLKGYSYKEISIIVNTSEDCVKKRVQRGKKKLKMFYIKNDIHHS